MFIETALYMFNSALHLSANDKIEIINSWTVYGAKLG